MFRVHKWGVNTTLAKIGEWLIVAVVLLFLAAVLIGGGHQAQQCADRGGHMTVVRSGEGGECVFR